VNCGTLENPHHWKQGPPLGDTPGFHTTEGICLKCGDTKRFEAPVKFQWSGPATKAREDLEMPK
jgi:hypothetical protein